MSEDNKIPYKDEEGYCSFNFLNKPAMIVGIPFGIFMFSIFAMVISFFSLYFTAGIIPAVVAIALIFFPMMAVRLICENDPNALKFMKHRIQAYVHKKKYKGKFYFSSINDIGSGKYYEQSKKTVERKRIY